MPCMMMLTSKTMASDRRSIILRTGSTSSTDQSSAAEIDSKMLDRQTDRQTQCNQNQANNQSSIKASSQGRHQLPALHELKTRCHHGSSRGRRLRARRYWLRFGGVGDIKQGVTLCGHQRNSDHTTTKRKETQIRVDSRACASPPTS